MTGYSEDAEGNVVLRMTREDYERVLLATGYFIGGLTREHPERMNSLLEWTNRLNAGNPNYTPYDSDEPKA